MGVFFCFVRLLVFNLGEVMRKGVRESYRGLEICWFWVFLGEG